MSIKTAKQQLVDQLEPEGGGYRVIDHVPARLRPPLILMSTGDPYITETDTFRMDEVDVHLELLLVVGQATNSVAVDQADAMVTHVLKNLGDWSLEPGAAVSAPFMATANDSEYLTIRVSVSTTTTLEGD